MNSSYGSGSFGMGGGHWQPPLFHIGKIPIHITGLVILLQLVGMLAVVILGEKIAPVSALVPSEFVNGAVWQVVTYPFFAPPSVWLLLGLYFFYHFGGMVENALGRAGYVRLLLAVMLTPATVVVLADMLGIDGYLVGSHLPHLAVFVAAIAMMPNAPTLLLGFPIKWLAVAFVAIAFLQYAFYRNWGACLALVAVVYLALWWMRRAGHLSQWGVVEDVFGPRSSSGRKRKTSRQKKAPGKKRVYEQKLKPRSSLSPSAHQDIDRILDKINEHGLHSLTEDERQILQKASKK
ncbi:rhomboid family intramembrane serine protease [Roseibacillus ishigakijimensis]|uniref:DUF6576 domain-containing protein n=1 Tax=Roseibacillus ishigakijimensis TaxID=454146 RepID=A0A934RWJ9_9BACT|nr:rhomboid family intramembrane serine protease [Roseibacillus ishigakijimensis]MBK1835470.1 hypothetical protein [Roseibacillus ishigakijimensis]